MIRDKQTTTPARVDGDGFDDTMQRAAQAAIAHTLKVRARFYARHPMALEALYPGLSCMPTSQLVAIAAHLVERESRSPRRWFGFGGDVSLINAKAALLLGRTLRRVPTSG